MRLALTLPISRAETPTSWLSRLAHLNGSLHANNFLKDLGFRWRPMTRGNYDQISELAYLTDQDSDELLRFALRRGYGKTRIIGSEPILSRLLSFEIMKVCPVCILNFHSSDGYMLQGPPIYWQLAPIKTCEIHNCALVTIPAPVKSRCKFDVAGRVRDHRCSLAVDASPTKRKASEYEHYIISRLCGDQRNAPTWLDDLDLAVIAKTCEHLGPIAFGGSGPSEMQCAEPANLQWRHEARLFLAIRDNPRSLKSVLHDIRQRPKRGGEGFRREFGRFAVWVGTLVDRQGVTSLLKCVRDFIEEAYPVATGQVVLGRRCKQRKLHSVMSVSHQYGIDHIRVRRLFNTIREQNGLQRLPPPDQNNCVSAKLYGPWLARYAESWNEKQAGAVLGMKWYRLDELVEADLLQVFFELPGMARRFERGAVVQLTERVFENSVRVDHPSKEQFLISELPNRCACTTVDIILAALDRKLPFVGRHPKKPGLSALIARQRDVLDALEGPPLEGLTQAEAFKRWRINTSTMACLVREGIIEVTHVKHPRNRRPMKIVSFEEVDRFESSFLTLGCIAAQTGTHPLRVLHDLRRYKVQPISLPTGVSCIYVRSEAEHYLDAYAKL
ncbi:hypothetical protein CEP88_14110 [Roseobacter denitrificans]|nr:TniQ family protein [Roseobacter denitrificans]AVL53627.1 hypothetical protein CEP88_14110 [Roseobacter denitrificans]SFF73207.1 TniQ protein [Roseobacter denitrificans OCh 114]